MVERSFSLGNIARDQKNDEQRKGILNLVRFAVPRNVYNEEHIKYTIAAAAQLFKHRKMIPKVVSFLGLYLIFKG